MELIFWISVLLIVFSYAIYPILLGLFARLFDKSDNIKVTNSPENWPRVSVIISAFNEESVIEERVNNLLSLDYPKDKMTILIGSDGSKDKTGQILSQFDDPRLQAHIFEQNRGKASVLNNLVEIAADDICVFSDANTNFEPNAIKQLVRHFANDNVGVVCGELNLFNPEGNDNKDSAYWRYEQFLKDNEGKLDALLGANGAIYAIRKELYVPIAPNTIVDDFLIVMNVARKGYHIVYDKGAIANEEVAPTIAEESKRRIRIGTGNYQAFSKLFWALNPMQGWRFFSYFSHKVLRWFTPHLMILALFSNIMLVNLPFYQACLFLQIAAYLLAFWGMKKSNNGEKLPSLLAFLTFFVSMNIALLRGFYRFAFTNVQGTWQRTTR